MQAALVVELEDNFVFFVVFLIVRLCSDLLKVVKNFCH